MTTFASIPVRANGDNVDYNFFNLIRLAGINVENFFGSGSVPETQFTIANNQSSAASITNLLIDPTLYRGFKLDYQIYRKTTGAGSTELAECGMVYAVYKTVDASWEITVSGAGDAGITFSVLASGHVQYISTDITGTPSVSAMRYKLFTMGVES